MIDMTESIGSTDSTKSSTIEYTNGASKYNVRLNKFLYELPQSTFPCWILNRFSTVHVIILNFIMFLKQMIVILKLIWTAYDQEIKDWLGIDRYND